MCKPVRETQGYKCHNKDMCREPSGHNGRRCGVHLGESRMASCSSPLGCAFKDEKRGFSSDSGCDLQQQLVITVAAAAAAAGDDRIKKLQNN